MKDSFYYKFYNFILNRNNKQEGFTIPELIVSGVVSLIVLLAGISLLRMNLQINKSDEVNLKLAGKVNSALDFIVDEINISQKVISSTNDIPKECNPLPAGDLVLALKIPSEHANEKKSYKTKKFVKANKDCPIIYNLVKNNSYRGKGGPYYILQRTGPSLNDLGYYEINNIKTTDVLDKVKNNIGDNIICGMSSGNKRSKKKEIKGIVLCIDEKGRGAEIMINAESPKINNQLTVTKSSGGYTMINDDGLINSGASGGGLMPDRCKFFGTCLITKKFTFFIDVSGSMAWSFQGKTLMEVAKEQLIDQIKAIPVNDDYMLQVYKFGDYATPVFPRPMSVNQGVKQKAIDFVSGLTPGGWTNPFGGLSQGIQEEHVEQMIILSDGVTYDKGVCFHNSQHIKFADCFAQYNEKIRNNDPSIPHYKTKAVSVDAISLKYDFCSGNNIPWTHVWYKNPTTYRWSIVPINKSWLGELSSKNNGQCKHIQ